MTEAEPQPDPGAEADTLHPERTLTIGGRTVTVRPHGWIEGVGLHQAARPLVQALSAVIAPHITASQAVAASPDEVPGMVARQVDYWAFIRAVAEHLDEAVQLIAAATGEDPDWIRGLDDADGHQLLLTYWVVNADFFCRRLAMVLAMEGSRTMPGGDSPSPTSRPSS